MKTNRTREILLATLMVTPLATSGCAVPVDEVGSAGSAAGECNEEWYWKCVNEWEPDWYYDEAVCAEIYCAGGPGGGDGGGGDGSGGDGGGGDGGGGDGGDGGGGDGECGEHKHRKTYEACLREDWGSYWTDYQCWHTYWCEGDPPGGGGGGGGGGQTCTGWSETRTLTNVVVTPAPGSNSVPWSDVGNATRIDNRGAKMWTGNGTVGAITPYLDMTDAGFSIAPDAEILGFEVMVRAARGRSGAPLPPRARAVQLIGPQPGSDNRGGNRLMNTGDSSYLNTYFPGPNQGANERDLWGRQWTPSQINASSFGVRLQLNARGDGNTYVDGAQVKVWWRTCE